MKQPHALLVLIACVVTSLAACKRNETSASAMPPAPQIVFTQRTPPPARPRSLDAGLAVVLPTDVDASPPTDTEATLTRTEAAQLTASGVTPVPVLLGGRLQGITLHFTSPSSALGRLGIRSGDRLETINEMSLDHLDLVARGLQDAGALVEVRLGMTRGAQRYTVRLHITP